jgi:hypothetical protein
MRHILHGIEIPVVGRDFDSAAPAAGAVEHQGPWIGDGDTIYIDLIIVKSFVLRI